MRAKIIVSSEVDLKHDGVGEIKLSCEKRLTEKVASQIRYQ